MSTQPPTTTELLYEFESSIVLGSPEQPVYNLVQRNNLGSPEQPNCTWFTESWFTGTTWVHTLTTNSLQRIAIWTLTKEPKIHYLYSHDKQQPQTHTCKLACNFMVIFKFVFLFSTELKNKQQFPVVVKTPVGPPATHRITQPSSTPFKDVTSDYYTGSHSDSSAVQHSDSFNVTKESADESISMSLKKLDLDENTTADGSISCHNEGESSMLSAVSGFEEEDRMSPLDTIDEKEIEDSQEIPSKEMRKHTQYAEEKWKKETRLLSSVKEGARDVMPPLEDGTNVKEKQMPPLEDRLGGRSPKSRKALLLENYNEIKEEEKRMNGKSRVTDFCPSSQLKENVLETKTSESQAPATLSMLPPVKPTHQSPLKNDQELRTEQSSTFSTPTSINCASGHSSTFNTPTSNKSNRKLKLAASFCGAKNTVDNSKRHPSTCPAVLHSRSAIPKDTQLSVDASTSQLVSSSQQQSDTSTCVLQEQIRSMEVFFTGVEE